MLVEKLGIELLPYFRDERYRGGGGGDELHFRAKCREGADVTIVQVPGFRATLLSALQRYSLSLTIRPLNADDAIIPTIETTSLSSLPTLEITRCALKP